MADISIRALQREDYAALTALWQATPGMGMDSASDNPQVFARFLARNPTLNYAAFHNATLIGVAMCGEDGRRGTLYHVAVHPDFQHQGIAHALVAKCEMALKALGIPKARLMVLRDNVSAQHHWAKSGWENPAQVLYYSKVLN